MKKSDTTSSGRRGLILGAIVFLVAVAFVGSRWWGSGGATVVEVEVPELSRVARRGAAAFDANCARCHGEHGRGTEKGPPLVFDIYNPGHHGDAAFVSAVRFGVEQHHWRFGDMPPQPRVSDRELAAIVEYVRELQEANGIFYKPHVMR